LSLLSHLRTPVPYTTLFRSLDAPGAVGLAPHVVLVVDRLVAALHHEAGVVGRQREVPGGIAHAHTVVEPPGALLGDHQVLLTGVDRKSTRLNSSHVKSSYAV